MLREEAVRLIVRSGKDLYGKTSGRVPAHEREKLERIISGKAQEKEFLFEKVMFLNSCFSEIPEDELLMLAGKMKYISNVKTELQLPADGFILWIFGKDKSEPHLVIEYEDSGTIHKPFKSPDDPAYCYLLPLSAVEEFDYQYTESSYGIYQFIDDNEE